MIRRIRRAVAAAGVVVLAAALVGAGCTSDAPQQRFEIGPERAPAWSAAVPAELGRPLRAQPAGDVVVVQGDKGVAAFGRSDGTVRWQRAGSTGSDLVAIAGNAVVIATVPSGAGAVGRILDLVTGAERGTFPVSGPNPVAVTTTTVYAVSSLNAGRPPRYRLSAVDPATATTRWQRDFAHRVEIATWATGLETPAFAARPAEEIVVNVETAESDVWQVTGVAADTGAEIARLPQPVRNLANVRQRLAEGTLLQWDGTGSECAVPATAYDMRTGQQRWQREFGRWEPASGSGASAEAKCGLGTVWDPRAGGGRLLSTSVDERPQVYDLASGAVRWAGAAGQHPVLMTGDVVLTRADHGTGDLAGVDSDGGAERWRIPVGSGKPIIDLDRNASAATDGRFALTVQVLIEKVKPVTRVVVVDAGTGKSRWATGTGAHLLGATADGTVTGRWADPLVGQVPTEISYYPPT